MSLLDGPYENRPARFATDAEWQEYCDAQNAIPQDQLTIFTECPHTRGAIDLDNGAWHCYACGGYVYDD